MTNQLSNPEVSHEYRGPAPGAEIVGLAQHRLAAVGAIIRQVESAGVDVSPQGGSGDQNPLMHGQPPVAVTGTDHVAAIHERIRQLREAA